MQFPNMDEDDVDFSVSGNSRSRLSSLFQNQSSSGGDINEALTFTAPKQPKKTAGENASGALKLIHAVIVHAYKLKDNSYTNLGKLGCAVLGHHETHTYKLLLYKGKQVQVTIVSITPSFLFHVQSNNYANFYDQKKENWSVNFDSETALFEFTKQVTLAKANSQGTNLTSLVLQDLVVGDGQALENGDMAEVKYSGWLLSNWKFGQMFDSNMSSESLFRVRLGKGKVIKGWNDGLVGMQKGGKRLLIIPSELAYGAEGMGNVIPPHSNLIFEIHVVRIKIGRESSHSPSPVKMVDTTADKKPDVPPRQSISQEDNIKMRGASISEQLTQSPKKDKAQLISRMAKMGTATLPFQGAVAAHVSSESESEIEPSQPSSPAPHVANEAHVQNVSRTSSPKTFSKSRSQTTNSEALAPQPVQASIPYHPTQPSAQILYAQSMMPSQQPFVCAATPFSAYPQPMTGQFSVPSSPYTTPSLSGYMPPVSTSVADSHLSLLFTETRNQNSEVRMSLSKITDKIDTVIQKVNDIHVQKGASSVNMPLMENAVILQNIERIIQENKLLKEENEAKVSKIQSLNEIVCDLFQRSQRLPEESTSMLEQKKELSLAASEEKVSNLEQEKSKLELELSSVSKKLSKLESDVDKYKKIESDLNQKLEDAQRESKTQTEVINEAQEKTDESKALIKTLQDKLQATEREKEILNMKLQSIEEKHHEAQGSTDLIDIYKKEIGEYKEKIEHLSKEISNSVSTAHLKEVKQSMESELAEVKEAKEQLAAQVKEMKKKVDSLEEQASSYEDQVRRLECEVENAQILKKKFEVFQEKTRALKETYEKQIVEYVNEIKHLKSTASVMPPEFAVEIKRVMNRLYKLLQGKFDCDASYTGSEALQTVLQTIMAITFQILENKQRSSSEGHADGSEPSGREEMSTVESQKEFGQQNGIKTEVHHPSAAAQDDEPSNHSATDVLPEVNKEECKMKGEESDSAVTEEAGLQSILETKVETAAIKEEGTNKSKVDVNETVNRESPENARSNIFSAGGGGTKV